VGADPDPGSILQTKMLSGDRREIPRAVARLAPVLLYAFNFALPGHTGRLKGARTRIPLRCGLVLVYEPAQDVAADEASSAVLRSSAIRPLGRLELQAAVRPVAL